jgi:predicted homoserine dehydrogenase-like protein
LLNLELYKEDESMIIVDTALNQRQRDGNPICVGLVGAGYMGRGIAYQIITAIPGMQLAAVYNRTIENAQQAYLQAGVETIDVVTSCSQLDDHIMQGRACITDDASLLCQSQKIDILIESTGTIEFAAHVVLDALSHGKSVVLMNAELDATLGPILKVEADKANVVITNSDGDQPGVIMNLFRYVTSIGFRPVLAGNMKGLHDPYRTPETQKGYAAKFLQKPAMVTSFADGTKISMEMAVVANATGFKTGKRGMYGPSCRHVTDAPDLFPKEKMLDTGLVDYVLGAEPAPGVFVIGYQENALQKQYLNYYKMGEGPFYVFYTPYHLCHLEAPLTAARAVLFNDAAITPLGAPVCDVVTIAKRNLLAGEIIDGIGGFTCYGVLENAKIARRDSLLPMGLSEGCRLKRDINKDQALSYDDIELPPGRLCDKLRKEQNRYFS